MAAGMVIWSREPELISATRRVSFLKPNTRVGRKDSFWSSVTAPRHQVIALVVLVFGPYLAFGLRTEHLAIYGCWILTLADRQMKQLRVMSQSSSKLVLLFSVPIVIGMTGLLTSGGVSPFPKGDLLASIDNAIFYVAAFALGGVWVGMDDRRRIVRNFASTIAVMLSLNSLIMLGQVAIDSHLNALLANFWTQSTSPDGFSVAMSALQGLRFTGIFNQPSEAGLAYGLGLMCILYLISASAHGPFFRFVTLVLILFGGIMTVSKIFFLLALPIAFISVLKPYRMQSRARSYLFAAIIGVISLALIFGQSHQILRITDFFRLQILTDFGLLSGGRYGENDGVYENISFVMRDSPLFGYGISTFGTGSDSEWLRLLGVSGLTGVLAIIVALTVLLIRLVTNFMGLPTYELILAAGALALLVGASFGFPAMSSNRAGSMLMVLIGILYVRHDHNPAVFRPQPPSFMVLWRKTLFLQRVKSDQDDSSGVFRS